MDPIRFNDKTPPVGRDNVAQGIIASPHAGVAGRQDLSEDDIEAFVDTVAYANLSEGRCHRLTGPGHAPFWEAPGDFDPVPGRFLRGRRNRPGGDAKIVNGPNGNFVSARFAGKHPRQVNGRSGSMVAARHGRQATILRRDSAMASR